MSALDVNDNLWTASTQQQSIFVDARIERAWALSSAHQSGLSIRPIAAATDLSPSRVHQILASAKAKDMPARLSRFRETDGVLAGNDEAGRAGSCAEMFSRLAAEVKVLRCCIDWLGRMERGENVMVNLRLHPNKGWVLDL